MHDLKLIRDDPEALDAGLRRRGLAPLSAEILARDASLRELLVRLQRMQARRNEELSRLQRTLLEEVRTYAKSQNYDIVLSGEAVLYNATATDITPAVLSALQARGGSAAGAAAPAKPPAK